ncbi:MAG: sigma factor-like helix-turn-helix DNA-binding protein [Armatimonadota bacterium]
MIEHRMQERTQVGAGRWLPPALECGDPATTGEVAVGAARVVRVALGRLGAVLEPWLDEGMLLGHGMMALVGALRRARPAPGREDELVQVVVDSLRRWIRFSSWYRDAWPSRVAPLCAALADEPGASDRELAARLTLRPAGLQGRLVEAGLLFGVSPELILPACGSDSEVLARALGALPREQRELLALYFQGGLSFPEIAQSLAIAPERAQQLYGRAAAAVRAALSTRACRHEVRATSGAGG